MRTSLILGAAAAALLSGCSKPEAAAPAAPVTPKAAVGSFGVDTAQMDTTVKPGDDFFKYVNGKWLASFRMPDDKPSYGTFDKLDDASQADVHAILDDLQKTPQTHGSTQAKVADLYASWMDQDVIEARGVGPLKPYLDRIAAVTTHDQLVALMSSLDFASPVDIDIQPDPDDTTKYAIWLGQSGLGMPNRDYYLKKGPTYDKYREAYLAYVTRLFDLIGQPEPAEAAKDVVALETKLAAVQWEPERQRNVKEAVNPMDLAALQKLAPSVDWKDYLAGDGVSGVNRVIVGETTAIRDGMKLTHSQPLAVWKNYLAFHVASDNSSDLPKAFDEASFEFFTKTLRGAEAATRPLEARRAAGQPADRGRRRRSLCRQILPTGKQGEDGYAGGEPAGGAQDPHHHAWMDGRCNPRRSAEETCDLRSTHRLPGQVPGLLGADHRKGKTVRERDCSAPFRMEPQGLAPWRNGRPLGVGNGAAGGERLLQPADEPDHLPGGDPAAALLRWSGGPGRELRRHRRRHRPRNRSWVR